jgi:hypothetical protein
MQQKGMDSGFDAYRRDRNQRRMQSGTPLRPIGKGQDVLREIEAAEAREVQEQRLTREVHDFFADATRTAATIVQKVTEVHENEASGRLSNEMEEFLVETIRRAQSFVQLLQFAKGPDGERIVDTHMQNLVGKMLDGFRNEGTAQLPDKHIGLDPMSVDLDVASAELRALSGSPQANDGAKSSIDEHLVAEVVEPEPEPAPTPEPTAKTGRAATNGGSKSKSSAKADAPAKTPAAQKPTAKAANTPSPTAAVDPLLAAIEDPEQLKETLKALVRTGVLTRDAAQDAYRRRLQSGAPN